ncbi:MAG: hypothetical protein AB3N28_08060 [Kordiimonas sp.]
MPYESQKTDISNNDLASFSGEINLLVFKVKWNVSAVGIEITTIIDFGVIQDTKTAVLSFHNPRAEFSVGVAGLSAGLEIGFKDSTGNLELTAKACGWLGCERSTTRIHILPPNALGLLAQNVSMEGINFLRAHFPHTNLGFDDLQAFNQLTGQVSSEMAIDRSALSDFMTNPELKDLNTNIADEITSCNHDSRRELSKISAKNYMIVLATIVTDSRVQEIYPGIDKKFEFPEEIRDEFQSQFAAVVDIEFQTTTLSAKDRNKLFELLKEICVSVAVISGITTSALGILAAICAVIVGLAAASIIGAPIGIIFLVAAIILTILAVLAATVGIIAAILALVFAGLWIYSNETIGAGIPYQGFPSGTIAT